MLVFAIYMALLHNELDILCCDTDVCALEFPCLPVAAFIAVKSDVAQALPCDAMGVGGDTDTDLHTIGDLVVCVV